MAISSSKTISPTSAICYLLFAIISSNALCQGTFKTSMEGTTCKAFNIDKLNGNIDSKTELNIFIRSYDFLNLIELENQLSQKGKELKRKEDQLRRKELDLVAKEAADQEFLENALGKVESVLRDNPDIAEEFKVEELKKELEEYLNRLTPYTENKSGYGSRYGFKRKDSIVIPAEYEEVSPFVEGLSKVKKGNKYGFITISGSWRIPPKYDLAENFSHGLSLVYIGDEKYFINHCDSIVFSLSPSIVEARSFSEGMAWTKRKKVKSKPSEGFIRIDGTRSYASVCDSKIGDFRHDRAVFYTAGCKIGEKSYKSGYGYLNKLLNWEILPTFLDARPYEDVGIARVKNRNGWGIIDLKGKPLSKFKFDKINAFSEGKSIVEIWHDSDHQKVVRYGAINNRGVHFVPCQYSKIGDFRFGFAVFKTIRDGIVKKGILNSLGQELFWGNFDSIRINPDNTFIVSRCGMSLIVDQDGYCPSDPQLWEVFLTFKGISFIDEKIVVGLNTNDKWSITCYRENQNYGCQYSTADYKYIGAPSPSIRLFPAVNEHEVHLIDESGQIYFRKAQNLEDFERALRFNEKNGMIFTLGRKKNDNCYKIITGLRGGKILQRVQKLKSCP